MDLTVPERNRLVPPIKYSHPYNKLWSMGQDDMAIPNKYLQISPEKQPSLPGSDSSTPHKEITSLSVDKEGTSSSSQGNITIPRPHGRKTPELGIVPPPPAPRVSKQQNVPAVNESGKFQLGDSSSFPLQTLQGPFGEPTVSDGYRQVSDSSSMDLLQPVKVSTDISVNDDILSLLDPLIAGQGQSDTMPPLGSGLQSSEAPHYSSTPCFTSLQSDFTPAAFPHQLGFSTPQPAFIHSPLNPFIQAIPPDHSVSVIGITARPFTPPVVSNSLFSRSVFYHSQRRPTPALSGSSLLSHVPSGPTVSTLMQPSQTTSETRQNIPPVMTGPSGHRTLPMTRPPSKPQDNKPREYPAIPPRPSKISDPVLLPSRPGQPKDPFDELLTKTREAVTPTPGKVEQLRKRWETFE